MPSNLSYPLYRQPLVDERGFVTRPWQQFLEFLFTRVGADQAFTNTELGLIAQVQQRLPEQPVPTVPVFMPPQAAPPFVSLPFVAAPQLELRDLMMEMAPPFVARPFPTEEDVPLFVPRALRAATVLETSTGSIPSAAVTPDGLAGSTYGTAVVGLLVSDPNGADLTTGDVKAYWRCPDLYAGWDLVGAAAHVTTASSSGDITVQVRNITQAANMLTRAIAINEGELDSKDALPALIDTTNDDVAEGDAIAVDVDAAGAGTKGLFVELQLRLP